MHAACFALVRADDWQGAHASLEATWLEQAGRFGMLALALTVGALIVRAVVRRKRYSAVDALNPTLRDALEREVGALEERTRGEIVIVVVERSDPHPAAHAWTALAALFTGSVLIAGALPWDRPSLVLAAQLALAALGYALSRLFPDVQRLFISEPRATAVSEEQALLEFQRFGLQETADRTGCLIFVSLLEHRVVVLADEGISARVETTAWLDVDAAVLAEVRRGDLPAGLLAGARRAGALLAEHFPSDGSDDNELSDHVIVRRE